MYRQVLLHFLGGNMSMFKPSLLFAVLLTALPWWIFAGEAPQTRTQLSELSIEDLLNIKITSVSKKSERANAAPAAIHVITQDDLRKNGVKSIAEALRLAPGMNVGKVDARQWAISARGFQDLFANKLLVLIDGRSVYTPAFSGTFWDSQDVVMEDIERIEVIRGPGAALWGANAVNGVINVITKSAKDTQGGLVTAGVGTEEHGQGAVRYGFKAGPNGYMRVYGKFENHADSILSNGDNSYDAWRQARGGARFDWTPTPENKVTIQGDGYHILAKQQYAIGSVTPPFERLVKAEDDFAGGNILGRWTHTLSEKSEFSLQAYYDRTQRAAPVFDEVRNTFDLDFQWRLPASDRHEIVWGAGYRAELDENDPRPVVNFDPTSRTAHLVTGFVQDDVTVIPDKLHVIMGTKLEHNSYTGFEIQPNLRVLWTPSAKHTVWGSVSRAVRTPSRAEHDVRLNAAVLPPGTLGPGTPAATFRILGDNGYESEDLAAYEFGYRSNPLKKLSFDIATFFNNYEHLRTGEDRPPFPEGTNIVVPQYIDNKLRGQTYGGEISVNYQPLSWWRITGQYSLLKTSFELKGNSTDIDALKRHEYGSPEHQFALRSYWDLPHNVEVSAGMRYVSRTRNPDVDAYAVGDMTIIWSPRKDLSISLTGQDLFDKSHKEYEPTFLRTRTSEVEHSVFLKLTFKF